MGMMGQEACGVMKMEKQFKAEIIERRRSS
jgi:hypothetical protein